VPGRRDALLQPFSRAASFPVQPLSQCSLFPSAASFPVQPLSRYVVCPGADVRWN
jgi:hypothetical protein